MGHINYGSSRWVPARLERLIAVRRCGAMILPADKSPFAYETPDKEALVALFVGGTRATGRDVDLELAGPPELMGALAGRICGVARTLGPTAEAQFTAAFDQAVAFQQDT